MNINELENVSNAIANGQSLTEILDLIVNRTRTLLKVEQAYIFLKDNELYRLKAINGGSLSEDITIELGQNLEGQTIQRGRILTYDDTNQETVSLPISFDPADTNRYAAAVAPIRGGAGIIGVLGIRGSYDPTSPQSVTACRRNLQDGLPFLSVLSDLASLAVDNTDILTRHQRRSQLIELLSLISSAEFDSIEEMGQIVATQIGRVIGAEKVDLLIHSQETDEMVALGMSDTPLSSLQRELGLDHLSLGIGGQFLEVYRSGQPFINGNVTPNDQPALIEKLGIRSLLIVPLQVEHQRLGVLSLASRQPDAFDQDDLSFVRFISVRLGYSLRHEELTEELARAEEARMRNDDRENIIAVVAHDLKNALTAIRGSGQIALRKIRRDDSSYNEKALKIVTNKATQALQLVEDMVDVHQMEKGSFRLFISPVELVDLVQQDVEVARALTARHVITFDSHLERLEIMADPNRLGQVLTNLLTNAIRYSPEGGTIRIRIEPALVEPNASLPQVVMVTVADHGMGISAHDQQRIFERFYRGDGAQVSSGSGLGLYISSEIISQHGGRLWLESQEGQGSQFHFTLPHHRTNT